MRFGCLAWVDPGGSVSRFRMHQRSRVNGTTCRHSLSALRIPGCAPSSLPRLRWHLASPRRRTATPRERATASSCILLASHKPCTPAELLSASRVLKLHMSCSGRECRGRLALCREKQPVEDRRRRSLGCTYDDGLLALPHSCCALIVLSMYSAGTSASTTTVSFHLRAGGRTIGWERGFEVPVDRCGI